MWGRAQRETTRRCASDLGHNLGKGRVRIPLVATSRVPNSVTVAYTARAVYGSTRVPMRYHYVHDILGPPDTSILFHCNSAKNAPV